MLKYIFPPRTKHSFPKETQETIQCAPWIAQYKFNDTRCIINITGGNITLWSRHAEQIKNYTPTEEITQQIHNIHKLLGTPITLQLDGGILHSKHPAIKNTIIIWDILVLKNQMIGTTYISRYNQLHNVSTLETYNIGNTPVAHHITQNIMLPINIPPNEWDQAWENIYKINQPYTQPLIEGLVYKNTQGKLKLGLKPDNNTDWTYKSRVSTKRHQIC